MIELYNIDPHVRHTDHWDLLRCQGDEVVEVSTKLTREQIAGLMEELHATQPPGTYYLRTRSQED